MIDSLSKEMKPVFAAYINMARQNAYNTLVYISKAVGIEENGVNKEANMWEMRVMTTLNGRGKPEQKMKIRQMLYRHFGLLRPWTAYTLAKELHDKTRKEYTDDADIELSSDKMLTDKQLYNSLTRIFKLMNYWRNKYSHFCFVDDTNDDNIKETKDIAAFLEVALDGARRVVKERFDIDDEFFEFLTGHEENDRMLKEPIEGQSGKKRKYRFLKKRNFRYSMTKEDGNISDVGILAFICMFLHKKYETEFVSQTKLVDGRAPKEQMIMREALAIYRIKLPKQRINSTSETSAVGMDMLGELHKCPDELFQTFCPEDQNLFRSENIYGEEVLYKRTNDRFPWFVLKYLDVKEVFRRIRFQVSLGSYRYKFYNKQCIDSNEADRVRILQKDINGFGRLGDMEAKRNDPEWNRGLLRKKEAFEEDTADTRPYITDKRASYIFHSNRIAMWWGTGTMYIPEIGEDKVPCEKPKCWMSTYDLQGMIFHHLLTKEDTPTATENIIIKCVENFQKLYADIKDGKLKPMDNKEELTKVLRENYGIEIGKLQEKLIDYLTQTSVDVNAELRKLTELRMRDIIERTQRRLDRYKDDLKMIGTKDNKLGKRRFVDIRPGRLASFLVRDMVKFQPVNSKMRKEGKGTGKMTGLNYNVLQGALATEHDILNLKRTFVAAGLLNSSNESMFLKKALSSLEKRNDHSIYTFYECYLQAKKDELESQVLGILATGKNIQWFYMRPSRNRWKKHDEAYYKKLAETYTDTPVELPRSLFFEPIKNILKTKYKDNKGLMAALNSEKGCNVTYLIAAYFKYVCEDECQNFYIPVQEQFKRHYSYFDILYAPKGKKVYYTTEQFISHKDNKNAYNLHLSNFYGNKKEKEITKLKHKFNDYTDNEKVIRRYKVQDMLLFLMAKNILITLSDTDIAHFKLKNISLGSESGILEKQVPFDITVKCVKDGETKKHTIHQDAIKIKNYGDFYRFLADDRMNTLLWQIENGKTIQRTELEEELKRYDDRRVGVFRDVHDFEEAVINVHDEFKTKSHSFRDLVTASEYIDTNEIDSMCEIRNAFGHNHYAETKNKRLPNIANGMAITFKDLVHKNKDK